MLNDLMGIREMFFCSFVDRVLGDYKEIVICESDVAEVSPSNVQFIAPLANPPLQLQPGAVLVPPVVTCCKCPFSQQRQNYSNHHLLKRHNQMGTTR